MCPTIMPIRSMVGGLPRTTEKAKRTHGRYGAVKGNKFKKVRRTFSFLRPQTYTIIKVKEEPRKGIEEPRKGAIQVIMIAPNKTIKT